MKIVCFLLILANIFVLLWEYRNGAFLDHRSNQIELTLKGSEQIILVNEQKKEPPPTLPNQIKELRLEKSKTAANIEISPDTKKAEPAHIQLP